MITAPNTKDLLCIHHNTVLFPQINLTEEESVLIIVHDQNHEHRSALKYETNTIDIVMSSKS